MAFFVRLIRRLNSHTSVKVKLLAEGFWRMARERVSKVGVAHNIGIFELAWEWKATWPAQCGAPQAPVHPVPSTQAPLLTLGCGAGWAYPGEAICFPSSDSRLGTGREITFGNLIFQPHAPPGVLEELPRILLVLHALLTNVAAFVLHSPQLPGTLPHRKTQPPAETRDKPRCGSNPTANGDRGKLYWTGTNL